MARRYKHILLFFVFILLTKIAFSQSYGNEWIDYSKTYVKIPIAKTGLYRISRQTLVNAGFPINNIQPKNIQLFAKGKEQYIYVYGEEDGVFNNNDYIEFYAEKNDGWLDSLMYDNPSDIANPYYSLINDTINYFLTWNNSTQNKRVSPETDTDFPSYTSYLASHCYVQLNYINPSAYYQGQIGSWYNQAEGWADNHTDVGGIATRTLGTPGYVNLSLPSYITFACIGASDALFTSLGNHHLKFSLNSSLLLDTIFTGYSKVKKSLSLLSSIPAQSNISIESYNDLMVVTDKIALTYFTLYYPRNFAFSAARQKFDVDDSQGSKSYIELTLPFSSSVVMWDLSNHRRIPVVYESGKYKALVPNSGAKKTCFISLEDSIYQATVMPSVIYTNYIQTSNNSDYIIITHPSLFSSANIYASHRNQTGYTSLVCDIEQLYDQYAYGIKKHPLAIQNFLRNVKNNFPKPVKHVFIIGKALHSEMMRTDALYYSQCLVPTFGTPPSDELLTCGLIGNYPQFSIGRLAATSNTDVQTYLNKVIEHEQQYSSPAEWQKRVLHFGGGVSTSEQLTFAGYLTALGNIIQDTLYGGFVQTFLKTTSMPIQITVSDSITNLINAGCGIMNFFGHATSGGFDQNIDDPSVYHNTGKYPFLLANTCLSGDIHLPLPKTIAEKWIIIPEQGAIAFLASTDLGNASYLFQYSDELYKQFAYKNFAKPIGKCIQETERLLIQQNPTSLQVRNTCFDFTLHGDPAVILPVNPLPDLTITPTDIHFIPSVVSSDIDTFDVQVIVTDLGRTVTTPFSVDLIRTFSDGSQQIYTKVLSHCYYKDTVNFRIPVDLIRGPGINHFCAKADAASWITEFNELNNEACVDFTITISDIVPVYPYEFAIYPTDTVTLEASTGYPFLSSQNFIFEMDTTDLFNSPFKKIGTVTHQGGVVRWKPPLVMTDSTVYFWHVAVNNSNPKWKESSFIYITGKTGWSQAHFFQYKKDRFQYLDYDRTQRRFEFITTPKQLHCQTMGANAASSYFDYWYNLDALVERSACSPAFAMIVVVIDPQTLEPWQSNRMNYGQDNYPICGGKNRADNYFDFTLDNLNKMATFIKDTVPNGYYILMYNFRLGNFSQWPEEAYQALESIGASHIRTIPDYGAYILFCKKGTFPPIKELTGGAHDTLNLYVQLPVNYTEGYVYSTLIGPSTHWNTLHWLPKSLEHPSADKTNLSVEAYKPTFDSTMVISNLSIDTLDIYNLSSYVNASQYPYMRLTFHTKDDSLKTSGQLKRWQITFDGVPETAINPEKGYYFYKDTVQEGETVKFAVATQNISPYNMDSLLVKYWIQNKNNQLTTLVTRRLRRHPAGDVLIDTVKFSSRGYPGLNHIWYEVNTINSHYGSYDQLEQYHFNNIAEKAFYVLSDKINPLLDVTFDGVRILDNDIVSAKPTILITLKDENQFLALDDTSSFAVYLTNLKTNQEKRIYFNNLESPMLFYKAQLPHNSCKIEYRPVLTDGNYMLRVQARDISNNSSGSSDYTIRFEVITQQTISSVLNYPNPFSSATHFVFTLTGSEVPDDIRIQIYTISGRLVREIRNDELGLIHIGRNITDFTWNGTDMYGDKLANGVYFYHVVARYKGQDVDHRDTDADRFFKHGFGKLYLMH
jgi:hypothetical protein